VPPGGGRVREGGFKKALLGVVVVQSADDLAVVVDAMRQSFGVDRVVDGGESAAAIKKTVGAAGIDEKADDLVQIVDAECKGATPWSIPGQGIVEGGVSAAVRIVEEGVIARGVAEIADDLAGAVDAL
jgi:hypothetical protein